MKWRRQSKRIEDYGLGGLVCARATAILLVFALIPVPICAQSLPVAVETEAKVKAAYIYQLINYIEWSPDVFASSSSPLVIGVVGDDPVNKYLKVIAAQRKARGRSIEYREVTTAEQAQKCHILFFSETVPDQKVMELITALPEASILFVGEDGEFLQHGGIVAFKVQNDRVRLQLSTKNAARRGLRVSSKLARVAETVD